MIAPTAQLVFASGIPTKFKMATGGKIDISQLRNLVRQYIDMHLYKTALFWADKAVSLSSGDIQDVYWFAQALFLTGQFQRAAHACIEKSRRRSKCRMGRLQNLDRTGSDRIDKTRTGSDRINKTWIGLRPIDKTRTGSEKNRIAINFPPKWSRGTSIEDGGERSM